MNASIRWGSLSAACALLILSFACASQTLPSDSSIHAIQATAEIPENQLLDVGIRVFDRGLPPEGEETPEGVFPELRRAESRYFAIHLEKTLQSTGQWGAVRVLPGKQGITELEVTGTILVSTGSKLALDIQAFDATGCEWLDRTYRIETDGLPYQSAEMQGPDPFQILYNEIANDLLKARSEFRAQDLAQIREIARLRFAADLAPEPYSDYLGRDRKGRVTAQRLPALDDPMMDRVDKIRARDDLFVDTLDQQFAAFYARMTEPYSSWRKYTFEEEQAYKALRRKALKQKILGGLAILGAALLEPGSSAAAMARDVAVFGGLAAINAGIATSKEAKIHVEALKELAASVESEVEPMVIEVEGQTLRLSGSAETQYKTWRQLLREIWVAETGLAQDPNTDPPRAGMPSGN